MDALRVRCFVLVAAAASLGASYRTPNFAVTAPTPEMAEQIGRAAEKFRRELAIEWLGTEMPNWAQPCPITAQVADHLGAGGATSFVFDHGDVFGWRMTIQGSFERILDSVLPHEVTHTIFATHFRQPLPRWADEGACTTVEHASERAKQQTMLIEFLRTGRGIAFNRMFAMKEYPHDVMPLYSQGYSVARYLVAQGGKRKFLDFVADGLRDENWARATHQHYSVGSLAELQATWLDWVRKGSPAIDVVKPAPALVAVKAPPRSRPAANLVQHTEPASSPAPAERSAAANATGPRASVYELASNDKQAFESDYAKADSDWHAPARPAPSDSHAAAEQKPDESEAVASLDPPQAAEAYQATRPQPVQRPGQVILEWSRPNPGTVASPPPGYAPPSVN